MATVVSEDSIYTVRGLLTRIRTEEQRRIRDTAALTFQLNKHKKKNQKLENEAKLERDKRRFKENELVNCRLALDRAYETVDALEKKLATCKEFHVHVDELDKAEDRHAVIQGKLLEKDSQLLERGRELEEARKTSESLRRASAVLKAKYDMMMKSEHSLALEVRELQLEVRSLKQASERRAELVGGLHSSDRGEAIKTLLRVGKGLQGSRDGAGYYSRFGRDREREREWEREEDDCSECSSIGAASIGAVSL